MWAFVFPCVYIYVRLHIAIFVCTPISPDIASSPFEKPLVKYGATNRLHWACIGIPVLGVRPSTSGKSNNNITSVGSHTAQYYPKPYTPQPQVRDQIMSNEGLSRAYLGLPLAGGCAAGGSSGAEKLASVFR